MNIGVVEEIGIEIGGAYTVLGIAWNDFREGGGIKRGNLAEFLGREEGGMLGITETMVGLLLLSQCSREFSSLDKSSLGLEGGRTVAAINLWISYHFTWLLKLV